MKKEIRLAIAVLAVAISFGLNIVGISPVLGLVAEKYSGYSTDVIQLLQTLPYAFLIVGALMVGWLTTKFSKKSIVLAGLAIIGICGITPFFFDSFSVLFISRLIIGYGFGIVGPMVNAVISEAMEPRFRRKYLGLHVVGMGIGGMAGNLIGANLAGRGLRYFYLVYLMAFINILIVTVFLDKTPAASGVKTSEMKLGGMVYVISAASFLHTMFITAYSTNISMYITQSIKGGPDAAGIATAVNAAFAMLVGIFFTQISGMLKRAALPFSFFIAAAGYAALYLIPGMPGVLITSALCGVSLSCFTAMGSYLIGVSVKPEAVAKASGVFSIIGSIGGLIAPLSLGAFSSAIGENTPSCQFSIAFFGMLAVGFLVMIPIKRRFGETASV